MRISDQGIQLLAEREGKRNYAYLDSVGVPTIGVGHTGPEVYLGLYWDDNKVYEVFRQDIRKFEDAVNYALLVCVNQHQFDALVSFAFNVGIYAMSTSTLIRRINEQNFADVPYQFNRWNIPSDIISRRNAEREQFLGTQFVARIP